MGMDGDLFGGITRMIDQDVLGHNQHPDSMSEQLGVEDFIAHELHQIE
jgi:hypothetical protein